MTLSEGIFAAFVLLLVSVGAYEHHSGYKEGELGCFAEQAKQQAKQDKKVDADYDKIDKITPFSGSDDAVAKFLRAYTSNR